MFKTVSILSNKFYRDFTNEEISNFEQLLGGKISKNAIIEMVSIGKNVTIQDGACIKNGTIIGTTHTLIIIQ